MRVFHGNHFRCACPQQGLFRALRLCCTPPPVGPYPLASCLRCFATPTVDHCVTQLSFVVLASSSIRATSKVVRTFNICYLATLAVASSPHSYSASGRSASYLLSGMAYPFPRTSIPAIFGTAHLDLPPRLQLSSGAKLWEAYVRSWCYTHLC